MNAAVVIDKDNFESTVRTNQMVLLDFWASWCGPCRSFAPIFENAAATNLDIRFGKINTEVERELATAFSITSIPTLVAIKNETVVFAQPGALPAAALAELVHQLRELDLDQAQDHPGTGDTAA